MEITITKTTEIRIRVHTTIGITTEIIIITNGTATIGIKITEVRRKSENAGHLITMFGSTHMDTMSRISINNCIN
jgi:hypothetical protein